MSSSPSAVEASDSAGDLGDGGPCRGSWLLPCADARGEDGADVCCGDVVTGICSKETHEIC